MVNNSASSFTHPNPEKILFFTYGFPIGGAEMFLISLTDLLDRSKFEPFIATLDRQHELEPRLNKNVPIFRIRGQSWIARRKKLINVVRENKIQKVIVIDFFCLAYFRLSLAGSLTNPKIFVSLHHTMAGSISYYLKTLMFSRFARRVDSLIPVCWNQAKYLSKRYFISRSRFTPIYNGIDHRHFVLRPPDFDRMVIHESYGIPPGAYAICQVAMLREMKRHEDSIRALKLITDRGISVYLLIVGDGPPPRKAALGQLALDLGVLQYVRFCGAQPDVRPYYWSSDLFTLSSNSGESFSIAALEAMSCGLPCVLTAIGGATEMVESGLNGYVVARNAPAELAEAWYNVLTEGVSLSAREIHEQISERFSIDKMVRQYEALLSE